MGTKAELEASNGGGGGGMVVALPPNSINSLSSSEVIRKLYYTFISGIFSS